MSFKDMVASDNLRTFLDTNTFGEWRTVTFDGNEYADIPCVLTKMKEQNRTTPMSDHEHGIYRVDATFHARLEDLNGHIPEKGRRFGIYDPDDHFLREYYVGMSSCAMGMVKLELEAYDE